MSSKSSTSYSGARPLAPKGQGMPERGIVLFQLNIFDQIGLIVILSEMKPVPLHFLARKNYFRILLPSSLYLIECINPSFFRTYYQPKANVW